MCRPVARILVWGTSAQNAYNLSFPPFLFLSFSAHSAYINVPLSSYCKIRYLSKFRAASRGSSWHSTAFLYSKSIMERSCTLNTATLLTRTHLAPKPKQNTLNHIETSFKVTHFRITEKPTWDCVCWRFRVGNLDGKVWASPFSRTPLSFGSPSQGTPANIRTNLIFLENTIIDLHFAADSMGLSSINFFLVASVKRFFPQKCVSAVQGHRRSLILVPIESVYATSYNSSY